MIRPQVFMSPRGPMMGVEAMTRITRWRPSVGRVRECILKYLVVGTAAIADEAQIPREAALLAPTNREVEGIADMAHAAVLAGRLIDFGAITNEVIKYGGLRGGALYNRGAIRHPFQEPWIFTHTWEGFRGDGTVMSVYLVSPHGEEAWGDCEVSEFEAVKVNGDDVLMIGDRVSVEPNGERVDSGGYKVIAMPSIWRYLGMADGGDERPDKGAAGNVLDPLMTGLLILSTRGILRETVRASDKLQRARAKSGKQAIPPHDRVETSAYVTAIETRFTRGRTPSQGGHHASPIPHLRVGHDRHLADGRITFVRDAMVNFSDEARAATRTHYVVNHNAR